MCRTLVHEMAKRGQIEILSGGFYEPILSIIPEEDRIGQIRMMNRFIEENFGVTAKGRLAGRKGLGAEPPEVPFQGRDRIHAPR